jgi:hypothetical protein
MNNNRQQILQNAVLSSTIEHHATLAARALTASTESQVTRKVYDHYQSQFIVMIYFY